MVLPDWGTNGSTLLGDKWFYLIGGQMTLPYLWTTGSTLLWENVSLLLGGEWFCLPYCNMTGVTAKSPPSH